MGSVVLYNNAVMYVSENTLVYRAGILSCFEYNTQKDVFRLSAQEKESFYVSSGILHFRCYRKSCIESAKKLFFRACTDVCPGSFVGRYRKKLPLKINYSCIGIKQCDGPSLAKVQYVLSAENLYSESLYHILVPHSIRALGCISTF